MNSLVTGVAARMALTALSGLTVCTPDPMREGRAVLIACTRTVVQVGLTFVKYRFPSEIATKLRVHPLHTYEYRGNLPV